MSIKRFGIFLLFIGYFYLMLGDLGGPSAGKNQSASPHVIDLCKNEKLFDVTKSVAIALAKENLGTNREPNDVKQVFFTDKEFMGGWLSKKPCWLLSYRKLPFKIGKDSFEVDLAVVCDGTIPVVLEAYTEPKREWWTRVSFRDDKVVDRYYSFGYYSYPPLKMPRMPLHQAIMADEVTLRTYGEGCDQIIARNFLYSHATRGSGIHRIDRFEIAPKYDRLPAWQLTFCGVKSYLRGGDRIYEEIAMIVDATTGKSISWSFYR